MLTFIILFGSVYGQGAYGSGPYGGQVIAVGPVQIPVTGASLWILVAITAFSCAVGLVAWARNRKINQDLSQTAKVADQL